MSKDYEARLIKYLRDFREVARKVKDRVRCFDPEAKVYVFGSVARGNFTAASDIDILIVTGAVEKKYVMMVEVYKDTEAPVELHVTTPEKFEGWYRRFIDPEEIIEI
ncbi:nucleotidyltransferase domain-containing protein [Candidatus Bathyarchaeota archaeon]|nr:nucleotidyltransferase domain-containing protein [Candidatus Bathyarchaeota archaeon]